MVGASVARGTVCAVEGGVNLFQRVRVQRLVNLDRQGNPTQALVRSLDEGWIRVYKMFQLLELPPGLRTPLPQAMDVHLCRLKPRDRDPTWSSAVNQQVTQWLSEAKMGEAQGFFLCGKIVLSVGGHLWLDPLECRQHLATTGAPTIHFSLRSKMVRRCLAVENPAHLPTLYQMCAEAGIKLPDYNGDLTRRGVLSRLPDETLRPDWAFLSCEEMQEVNLSQVVTPSSFFVQRVKFQTNLDDLLDDICSYQNKQRRQAWKKTPTEPGSTVLAKYPADQVWNRAQVERKEPSGEFLIFFVDYGDRAIVPFRDLLPLPDQLLSKLPFQAIECSLAGVCPCNLSSWPETASDSLHQLSLLGDDLRALVVKVTGKMRSTVTGGWRYAVRLYDLRSRTELGEELVASGEARFEAGWGPGEGGEGLWGEVGRAAESCSKEGGTEEKGAESGEEEEELPFYQAEEAPKEEVVILPGEAEGGSVGLATVGSVVGAESFDVEPNDDLLDDEKFDEEDVATFLETLMGAAGPQSKEGELIRYMKSQLGGKGEEVRVVEEPPSSPQPPTKHPLVKCAFTPTVVWRQDESWVTVKVGLAAVERYNLRVGACSLDFLTELEGRVYSFSASLFGYVDPQRTSHAARGQYVEVKLYKLACFPWPRLERPILPPGHRTPLDVQTLDVGEREEDEEEDWRSPEWASRHKAGSVAIPATDTPRAEGQEESDEEGLFDEGDNLNFLETFDPYNPLP